MVWSQQMANNAEIGLANGAAVTAPLSSGGGNDAFAAVTVGASSPMTVENSSIFLGSLSYQIVQTTTGLTYIYFDLPAAVGDFCLNYAFRMPALPTASCNTLRLYSDAHITNIGTLAHASASGKATWTDTASAGAQSPLQSNALGVGWYDLQMRRNGTAMDISIYPQGSATATEVISMSALTAASVLSIRLGIFTASSLGTLQLDSIMMGTGGLPPRPDIVVTNNAPVIAQPADVQLTGPGTINLTATITDDVSVATATWTRISGPNSPTITPANVGIGTPSVTANATAPGIAGRYVFQINATDGPGLVAVSRQVTVYVPAALDAPVGIFAETPGPYLDQAASVAGVLPAITDGSAITYATSTAAPVGDTLIVTMNPYAAGASIKLNMSNYQTPSSPPLTITAALYREDAVTLLDTQTFTAPTVTAPPVLAGDPVPLTVVTASVSAAAAVPNPADRRALQWRLSATQ